jgi:hypothetical protein
MRCSIRHFKPLVILVSVLLNSNSCITGDSGDDSEDEGERRNEQKRGEEDAEELGESDSPVRHNTR